MKEKFIVTIPVYKSGNTKLTKYISEINCNTLIVPQISSVRADPSSLAYHIKQKYNTVGPLKADTLWELKTVRLREVSAL